MSDKDKERLINRIIYVAIVVVILVGLFLACTEAGNYILDLLME